MEQSAVKQRQANSKEGSVAVTESNMKPTEKEIHVGNEEGVGEEEQLPEEDPLTASQIQTQEFQQLNEELYKIDDDFAEDIEGQFTLDTIRNGIGRVATIHDNTKFAFTSIDVEGKKLVSLYEFLKDYPHVRRVNLSNNKLKDIKSVTHLPHLTTLKADRNEVKELKFLEYRQKLQYLIEFSCGFNKITDLPDIHCPRLKILKLNNNRISNCDNFMGHPLLETLDLQNNKLKSTESLSEMPNLKSLTLSYNDISDISGLKELLTLQFLDLSFNKQLESFSNINLLPSLVILNFHESGIKELQDIKSLLPFKKLSELNLSNTPLETEVPDLKSEVVMILLRKFVWWRGVGEEEEKEEITDDDLNAADEALKQRAEEEAERKRQEEEAERMREEEEENERLRLEEERKAQEGNEDQAAADPSED